MRNFILKNVILPLSGRWIQGLLILLFWTVSFVALPAISGWFLATCSVVFMASGTLFSYLVPSSVIRLLTMLRTAARYFERIENHKTTLEAQRNIQLKIFQSVASFPYFRKQVNNNSTILENSTHGIDLMLNHILLWMLPFTALIISLGLYVAFLYFFSETIALEFILSSAILLFLLPQYIFLKNRKLYQSLKASRDENNQLLIQSFRGSIEISKFQLEQKAIDQHTQRMLKIENLEKRLQTNSFTLQMLAGLGFSLLAVFIFWGAGNRAIDAPFAIGIFFGMLAQAELAEMLFAGKSEKSAVQHHVNDLNAIIQEGATPVEEVRVEEELKHIVLNNHSATVPGTNIVTEPIQLEIEKGDWIALFGATGKGKTTFLNSLFYPEYRRSGTIIYNYKTEISRLPVPECIYVTQKAYLLTGTLRENFESYAETDIFQVLQIVDLKTWYDLLPDGLDTWLGENGETLSGGQRKKLLLAQALLKKPQLLVVDEPTAGISTDNAISIFRHIRKENPGITILMATHLKAFEEVVDKVVRM